MLNDFDFNAGEFRVKSYNVDVICKADDETRVVKTVWAPLLPHQNPKIWEYSMFLFNDNCDRTNSKTKTRDLYDISDEFIKESYLVYWFRN